MNIAEIIRLTGECGHLPADRIALSNAIGANPEERRIVALQVSLQAQILRKLPSWSKVGVFIPHSLNLEQASSEETAIYKQRFINSSDVLLDLTGGMGVDFWAMSSISRCGVYVEQDEVLFAASAFNLPRLMPSSRNQYLHANSIDVLEELITTYKPTIIYVDPARRINQKAEQRVFAIEDCSPSLLELEKRITSLKLQNSLRLLAKLSPMLDIKHCLAQLSSVVAVWVIALKGEVKELLLELNIGMERRDAKDIPLFAVDLPIRNEEDLFSGTFRGEEELCPISKDLGQYLYEPNGAIMKLGLYQQIGRKLGLKKLHQHTHLYTSDEWIKDFPGRVFRILDIYPYQSKVIKRLIKGVKGAQITCRNFPLKADQLRLKLRLKEDSQFTIVATTFYDGSQVLVYTTRP